MNKNTHLKKSPSEMLLARMCGAMSSQVVAVKRALARTAPHDSSVQLRFEIWPALRIWYVQRIVFASPKFGARAASAVNLDKPRNLLSLCWGVVVAVKDVFRAQRMPQQGKWRSQKTAGESFLGKV